MNVCVCRGRAGIIKHSIVSKTRDKTAMEIKRKVQKLRSLRAIITTQIPHRAPIAHYTQYNLYPIQSYTHKCLSYTVTPLYITVLSSAVIVHCAVLEIQFFIRRIISYQALYCNHNHYPGVR